jgi:hypothetical protein
LIATDASPAGAPNFLPNESPDLIRDGPAGADGTVYAVDLIGQINQLRAEIAVLKTLVVHVVLPKLK